MVKPSTSSSPHILLLLLMLLLVTSISLVSSIFISLASSMFNIGWKERCTGYSCDFTIAASSPCSSCCSLSCCTHKVCWGACSCCWCSLGSPEHSCFAFHLWDYPFCVCCLLVLVDVQKKKYKTKISRIEWTKLTPSTPSNPSLLLFLERQTLSLLLFLEISLLFLPNSSFSSWPGSISSSGTLVFVSCSETCYMGSNTPDFPSINRKIAVIYWISNPKILMYQYSKDQYFIRKPVHKTNSFGGFWTFSKLVG